MCTAQHTNNNKNQIYSFEFVDNIRLWTHSKRIICLRLRVVSQCQPSILHPIEIFADDADSTCSIVCFVLLMRSEVFSFFSIQTHTVFRSLKEAHNHVYLSGLFLTIINDINMLIMFLTEWLISLLSKIINIFSFDHDFYFGIIISIVYNYSHSSFSFGLFQEARDDNY